MTADLGTTNDPKALVPGDADAVRRTAAAMTAYGDELQQAGDGLRRIDSTEGWSGEAAEQFRSAFHGEPGKWLEAGECFYYAGGSLDQYSDTLAWAQGQAAGAIQLWNEGQAATQQAQAEHAAAVEHAQQQAPPGAPPISLPFADLGEAKRQAARDMLARARSQLAAAGEQAADVVGRARDKAPDKRNWMDQAGHALGSAVNSMASVGNAVIHNPGLVAGLVGGAALTTASAAGEVAGVVLDATGVGAVGGGPLNVVSGAGIAAGVGMMGVSMAGLGAEATGEDEVHPIDSGGTDEPPAPALPWEDPAVQEKVPAEWGEGKPNRSGVGHRWADPENPSGSGVRIDKGDPNVSNPTQHDDHVVVRDNGKVIGRDGKPVPDGVCL
jgi:hypothetical protein